MKILLFPNPDYVHPEDPTHIVRMQIYNDWHVLGFAGRDKTPKGTPYFELDLNENLIVDKLKEVDWEPNSDSVAEWLASKHQKWMAGKYPEFEKSESQIEKDFNEV